MALDYWESIHLVYISRVPFLLPQKKKGHFLYIYIFKVCNRVALVKELNIGEIQIHFCLPSDNTSNYGWEGCGGHGTYR